MIGLIGILSDTTFREANVGHQFRVPASVAGKDSYWSAQENVSLCSEVVHTQEEVDQAIVELSRYSCTRREIVIQPTEDIPALFRMTLLRSTMPIHGVILKGETGRECTLLSPGLARSIRDQCKRARADFQLRWGSWLPRCQASPEQSMRVRHMTRLKDRVVYDLVGPDYSGGMLDDVDFGKDGW